MVASPSAQALVCNDRSAAVRRTRSDNGTRRSRANRAAQRAAPRSYRRGSPSSMSRQRESARRPARPAAAATPPPSRRQGRWPGEPCEARWRCYHGSTRRSRRSHHGWSGGATGSAPTGSGPRQVLLPGRVRAARTARSAGDAGRPRADAGGSAVDRSAGGTARSLRVLTRPGKRVQSSRVEAGETDRPAAGRGEPGRPPQREWDPLRRPSTDS